MMTGSKADQDLLVSSWQQRFRLWFIINEGNGLRDDGDMLSGRVIGPGSRMLRERPRLQ